MPQLEGPDKKVTKTEKKKKKCLVYNQYFFYQICAWEWHYDSVLLCNTIAGLVLAILDIVVIIHTGFYDTA